MAEPALEDSLWAASAPPPVPAPPLAGESRADVCIVGAGYTGLSAALRLAEGGASVAVLDAEAPGWGASGRNGGQVIPGLKHDPDELLALFGPEDGGAMVQASAAAADLVFALIGRYGIECEAVRTGWLQPAHVPAALPLLRRRHAALARHGFDVGWLEAGDVARLLGRERYHGGWIDRRGGSVQPLGYARGLARAALGLGVRLHGASRATALKRHGLAWHVSTPGGRVVAEQVLLATNGYTDGLWPGLKRTVVPVLSVQVASEPLSENLRRSFLPERQTVSDTHRLLWYYRTDAAGRAIMGGGGSAYAADLPRLAEGLRRRLRALLPEAAELRFRHAWGGRVALTPDHLPHLHELAPGLMAGLGYNGRGVAMATMLGHVMAERALGLATPRWRFPAAPPKPFACHALHGPAVTAVRMYYRLRDRLDDRKAEPARR